MNTIIIPVSKNNPEDNYLDLVKILAEQFSDSKIVCSDALVIETDNPVVAGLFREMVKARGEIISSNGNGRQFYSCTGCGATVSKEGGLCVRCARQKSAEREKGKPKGRPKKPEVKIEFAEVEA